MRLLAILEINMTDEQLIAEVARIWVDAGGDAEGIDWNVSKLKDAINTEIEDRIMNSQIDEELERQATVTREMALDAGDPSLEGMQV